MRITSPSWRCTCILTRAASGEAARTKRSGEEDLLRIVRYPAAVSAPGGVARVQAFSISIWANAGVASKASKKSAYLISGSLSPVARATGSVGQHGQRGI